MKHRVKISYLDFFSSSLVKRLAKTVEPYYDSVALPQKQEPQELQMYNLQIGHRACMSDEIGSQHLQQCLS